MYGTATDSAELTKIVSVIIAIEKAELRKY